MTADVVRAVPAEATDRPQIERLMQAYLRELSGTRTVASEAPSYPYLDPYWTEPDRRALLIRSDDRLAGFALVNAWAPSGLPVDHAMAEFFVVPDCRRKGIGGRAAIGIITASPGCWEIGVLAARGPARAFWTHVVKRMTGAAPAWREGDGKRWSGQFLRFRSSGQG
jgi:predicted acetyltransferase